MAMSTAWDDSGHLGLKQEREVTPVGLLVLLVEFWLEDGDGLPVKKDRD